MPDNPAVNRFLDAVRTASTDDCDAWAPDVLLDATVPQWRFHRRGADQLRTVFRSWFADPGEFEQLQRIPIDGGEVVDWVLRWEEDGVPHTMHQVHILELAEGRITRDLVMCGGRWPAPLMARMAAADDH